LTVNKTGILQISFQSVLSNFYDHDSKKKVQDNILSTEDRRFLHLLVGADEFKDTTNPDLLLYVKLCHFHLESVRLIQKFHSMINEIDRDLIEKFWNPCANRTYCEIVIFISQFFGRAERVMEESKVKELWSSHSTLCERLCERIGAGLQNVPEKASEAARHEG
jgi:succinate dehydrogenase flavin-adding protein (antitoxin of CptAB toxin-antitoxin module)